MLALSISLATTSHPCDDTYWFVSVADRDVCYKYYTCLLGSVDSERTCDYGTVFDPAESSCVPGDQETCEIFLDRRPTVVPTITTTLTPPINPCGTGRWPTTVAHPDNCYQYFSCVPMSRTVYTNVPVLGNCTDAHVFNPEVSKCVPGDPETCEIFE